MKKLAVFPAIALLTFAIGVTVQSFRNLSPTKSNIVTAPTEQILTRALTEQPPPSFPAQPPPPEKENSDLSVVFQTHESDGSLAVRHFKLQKNRPTLVQLDLSESVDGQEVTLNFRDYSAEYRILQRYRTSMSVSFEGPHADLVDWRHFDSPWTELKSIGPKRFRTLASEEMDWNKFPPTTKSEIVKEVRRLMEKEWPEAVELVKSCNGPNDGACMVSISSIYLRIQKQVGGNWTDIGSIEFQVPMGC